MARFLDRPFCNYSRALQEAKALEPLSIRGNVDPRPPEEVTAGPFWRI